MYFLGDLAALVLKIRCLMQHGLASWDAGRQSNAVTVVCRSIVIHQLLSRQRF